jgi:tetratricopeptide (TPR) repeat protein
MSATLTKARQQINSIGMFLKQGKLTPAAAGLYDAVMTIVRTQLMKAEKEEFSRLVEQGVYQLNNNKELRKVFPLVIAYKAGEEKDLLETLRVLLNALQASVVDEAKDNLAALEKHKRDALAAAQEHLDKGEFDQAKDILGKITREFPKDSQLQAQASDMLLRAELFEDAFDYLDRALQSTPDEIHLYNRIAVVLRKMKKYDIAEKYFMRAVNFAKNDPNLYFNLGRVYIDWQRWDKVEKAARIALKLLPGFEEADKMLAFALRRQGKTE